MPDSTLARDTATLEVDTDEFQPPTSDVLNAHRDVDFQEEEAGQVVPILEEHARSNLPVEDSIP